MQFAHSDHNYGTLQACAALQVSGQGRAENSQSSSRGSPRPAGTSAPRRLANTDTDTGL